MARDSSDSNEASVDVRRVYDAVREGPGPGQNFLVDRVWPRGVAKDSLEHDAWLRDVAPSPELRKWFGHDPERWEEFTRRYRAELDARPEALQPLLDAARQGPVTLLYAARDTEHNHARVLRDYLAETVAQHR
ncbi:uncharacterized protein YeaO (DUF488 family) [Lipingzhangella halophila]|uniref:Uncharacterized protein YeaO (DUF488 family) n=1 Tax=Lipingzhangella halophila TaxID=1783352 RepID=A0A7W7RID1_9ACTN|nr:DUF488 family protein [Lipingzhangella halophila]MBB4932450.1 uncharacterized protein YeaO (DUF488 family) [Lipingzhangella halophila]